MKRVVKKHVNLWSIKNYNLVKYDFLKRKIIFIFKFDNFKVIFTNIIF